MRTALNRFPGAALAAVVVLFFSVTWSAHADWSNFGTISMTDPVTPRLTGGYLCYTDGRDIACNTSVGPVTIGTGGLIDSGGITVAGSVSASAVSATYVSATVLQINSSGMPCGSSLGGTIRYNAGTLQYCDGVGPGWQSLANGSSIQGDRIVSGTANAIVQKDVGVRVSGTFIVSASNDYATSPSLMVTSGAVGIGRVPSFALDIWNPGVAAMRVNTPGNNLVYGTSTSPAFYFPWANANDAVLVSSFDLDIGTQSWAGVHIATLNAERMTVLPTGNVGVSNTNPQATLSVSGTVQVAGSGAESCSTAMYGALRVNPSDGSLELCRQ